jgi:hypothetical protein
MTWLEKSLFLDCVIIIIYKYEECIEYQIYIVKYSQAGCLET